MDIPPEAKEFPDLPPLLLPVEKDLPDPAPLEYPPEDDVECLLGEDDDDAGEEEGEGLFECFLPNMDLNMIGRVIPRKNPCAADMEWEPDCGLSEAEAEEAEPLPWDGEGGKEASSV